MDISEVAKKSDIDIKFLPGGAKGAVCPLNLPSTYVRVFRNPQTLSAAQAWRTSRYPPVTPAVVAQVTRSRNLGICGTGVNEKFALTTTAHIEYVFGTFTTNREVDGKRICPVKYDLMDFTSFSEYKEIYNRAREALWETLANEPTLPWPNVSPSDYKKKFTKAGLCDTDFLCSFVSLQISPSRPFVLPADFHPENLVADERGFIVGLNKVTQIPLKNDIWYIPSTRAGTGIYAKMNEDRTFTETEHLAWIVGLLPPELQTNHIRKVYAAATLAGVTLLHPDAGYIDVSCTCWDAGAKVTQYLLLLAARVAKDAGKTMLQLAAASAGAFRVWSNYGFTQRVNDCSQEPEKVQRNAEGEMWRMTKCLTQPLHALPETYIQGSTAIMKEANDQMEFIRIAQPTPRHTFSLSRAWKFLMDPSTPLKVRMSNAYPASLISNCGSRNTEDYAVYLKGAATGEVSQKIPDAAVAMDKYASALQRGLTAQTHKDIEAAREDALNANAEYGEAVSVWIQKQPDNSQRAEQKAQALAEAKAQAKVAEVTPGQLKRPAEPEGGRRVTRSRA